MFEHQTPVPGARTPRDSAASRLAGRWRHLQYLPVLVLGVACSGRSEPVAPDVHAGNTVASSAAAGTAHGDLRGVEELISAFAAAWAAKDAAAYAANYAVDADFVNPIGAVIAGRAAIQAVHTGAFAGPAAPSTLAVELKEARFLTGTTALLDVNTTLAGTVGPPPPFAVVSPDGAVRSRTRWLAVKVGNRWEILVSYHRGWGF